MQTNDEQQLITRLTDPKTRRQAFEQVVRQYSEQLYWQVRRIVLTHDDSHDVLQNAFMKAWASIDQFHGDSKVITWLTRIAVNEALDFNRRRRNHPVVSTDEDDCNIASQLMADDYFDGDSTDAQLQEVIAQLPEVQRTVFLMRYYDEMKYSEISQVLDTSEGALKASYHIAVKKITEFFKSHD